ncbi:hypothetical protein [Caudoviricetes sp.]|nr:hypothetical protein [Caudoviricetes sp.]
MGLAPQFAATPKIWVGLPTTADTSLTAPTNAVTLGTAGTSGSKINRIMMNQVADIASATVVNLFLHDGTTYHLFDTVNVATFDATTSNQQDSSKIYDKSFTDIDVQASWTLRATVTTTSGQSAIKILAFVGDN